jgi:succinate dehydrogenase / fumarate reductase iron-sulfur subunit
MSCSTLIINLPVSTAEKPIVIEPLEKFPVIRDLTVDRSKVFQSLTYVRNWIETDDIFGSPLTYTQNDQSEMYSYSKCINCGSCYDSCPRTEKSTKAYLGPAAIAQVVKLCIHPNGQKDKNKRLAAIMADNGISKCGKALMCEEVCPKSIPLIRAIGYANRKAIKSIFKK